MQSVSDDDVLKDFLKSHVLSRWRKVYSDWEDVTSSGRAFWVFGPVTGKAQLLTVDLLTGGTRRWLVPVEWSDCLPWNCILAHVVQVMVVQFHKELWMHMTSKSKTVWLYAHAPKTTASDARNWRHTTTIYSYSNKFYTASSHCKVFPFSTVKLNFQFYSCLQYL